MVDALEESFDQLSDEVVRDVLAHREHAHARAAQLRFHDACLRGVAGEARGVVNDDDRDVAAGTKRVLEHATERGTTWMHGGATGLDVLANDRRAVTLGVLLHGTALRGDRQLAFGLRGGAHAEVTHPCVTITSLRHGSSPVDQGTA